MHFKLGEPEKVSRAKQRASIAWLVQKAHKNKVPSDMEDPYYKDYEGMEHLKPGIVHRLSNADLYCSALANIYGDPNFHNLSHWNIIQALARKGVYVAEPTDVALTETVLIQTTPIKMTAHLAVIEALMSLYIREVVIAERVVQSIQRIRGHSQTGDIATPQDQEEALVLWVEHCTQALQARIYQQLQPSQELPVFPKIQDLSDLSDGIGLAALISYYCPQELSWGDIAVADPPSMADSLYNIDFVIKFCRESLPYNPCLLTKEDIVYMHSSVKQNILAFVSELFFLMELEPVSCVSMSTTKKSSKYIQLSSPGAKPAGVPSVRRSHSMNLNDVSDNRSRAETRSENAPSSHNSDYGGRESSMSDGQDGEFMVQKAKGYATLSDMMKSNSIRSHQQLPEDPYHYVKESYNLDSKDEELGERGRLSRKGSFKGSSTEINKLPPAGLPSRYVQAPAGRSRSRRNSISAEESQLTIENFGGSQDNLNWLSRNPEKDLQTHSGKTGSYSSDNHQLQRSFSQIRDVSVERQNIDEMDNKIVDKLERDVLEREKRNSRYGSKERISISNRRRSKPEHPIDSSSDSEASYDRDKSRGKATNFAELSKLKDHLPPGGINIIYMQSDRDESNRRTQLKGGEKKTTFATLPNQTTWKQQSVQSATEDHSDVNEDRTQPQVVSTELHNVRLKLEEKRHRIESEKLKMELMMNKERQKIGKEVFMKAVAKGDLGTEVSNVSKKWLENQGPTKELRTPDIDAMDYDECQQSLTQMTDSLTEIQGDIQRLSSQQHQIQSLMQNGINTQQNQFYLHDQQQQQGSPARRMWGQQPPNDVYSSTSPATRRAQWGPPARPMVPQGDYMMGGQQQQQQPSSYYQYQMSQNPPQQLPQLHHLGQPPSMQPNQAGFMLHNQPHSFSAGHPQNALYLNGGQQPPQPYYSPEQYRGYPPEYMGAPPLRATQAPPPPGANAPFRLHEDDQVSTQSSPSHQYSSQRKSSSPPPRQIIHTPVAAPPPDDMEPQNVCFIEGDGAHTDEKLNKLPIQSGSRTYRITHEPGSPTRPSIGTKTFIRVPTKKGGAPIYDDEGTLAQPQSPAPKGPISPNLNNGAPNEKAEKKGFYISLDDNDTPKRPKPPLRTKKMAIKKVSSSITPASTPSREELSPMHHDNSSSRERIDDDSSPYGSLKIRRSGSGIKFPTYTSTNSRPDLSPPPVPAKPLSLNRLSHPWSPQLTTGLNKNNLYDTSRSDSGSDLAFDDKVVAKRATDSHSPGMALVIGDDLVNQSSSLCEMEKKKERLMMMSMRRQQQQEESKRKKEIDVDIRREEEKQKEDHKLQKKEGEKARRELILERHKIKKAIEEAEKEGRHYNPPAWYLQESGASTPRSRGNTVRMRSRGGSSGGKPRPKTMHEASYGSTERLGPSRGKKGSFQNISGEPSSGIKNSGGLWGSSTSLSRATGPRGSTGSLGKDYSVNRGVERGHSGRRPTSVIGESGSLRRRERSRGSLYGSQQQDLNETPPGTGTYRVHESRRPSMSTGRAHAPYKSLYESGRKYCSTGNIYGEHESLLYHMSEDSGLGRATPPRRAPSPGMSSRHLPSPSGPGSLPPGLFSRRRPFDDNMSDISNTSSNMDYCGPRLFKQPTSKSNRAIILNAVEYCIFPGVVNQTAKHRVLEEVARSESKHFLIMFRDAGCQFRALYSYNPDIEDVSKLYGTGPKQISDRMFEKFFKYNSGGKCFSTIHTKHLTCTIDAFTIHNSLWQGKRVSLPSKKDMKLVI